MDIYHVDPEKTKFYNGIEYRIISFLDNDLLLCVSKEEVDKGSFPLNTVIIPA